MESPNQYLSPEPSFARIAPTSFEIQGSKVCSTVRPLPLRHCCGRFQGKHVWKAPPVPFTRTFFCQDCSNQFRDPRVQSVLDYPPPHSAPLFWLVSRKPCMESPTSTFHQNLLLPGLLQPVSRSKGPKCARLSAPSLCATVVVGFKETMYEKPQPVPFTRTFFCQDCSNQFPDPRVQSVLDYPPPHSAPLFW